MGQGRVQLAEESVQIPHSLCLSLYHSFIITTLHAFLRRGSHNVLDLSDLISSIALHSSLTLRA